jgi:hypothetical protein
LWFGKFHFADGALCKTGLQDMQKIDFLPKDIAMKDVKRLFGFFTPAKYDFAFLGGVSHTQRVLSVMTVIEVIVQSSSEQWKD